MLRILLFLLIMNLSAFAQTGDVLRHIRDRYQEVNKNINTYKMIGVDIPDISSEGAGAEGYFKEDTLQLIVDAVYGEMAKSRMEIYYDEGMPVFFYYRYYRYEVPMYDSTFDQHKIAIEENRGYFHNGKMIRWIDERNKQFTVRDAAFIETEQHYLESAADLYKLIIEHRFDSPSQE